MRTQLVEKTLHDARVTSFEMPLKDTFVMALKCRDGFHNLTNIRLTREVERR